MRQLALVGLLIVGVATLLLVAMGAISGCSSVLREYAEHCTDETLRGADLLAGEIAEQLFDDSIDEADSETRFLQIALRAGVPTVLCAIEQIIKALGTEARTAIVTRAHRRDALDAARRRALHMRAVMLHQLDSKRP